jgi:hypothetical protein
MKLFQQTFKQKTMLVGLVMVFFFGLYWRVIGEPALKKSMFHKAQILKSRGQLKSLASDRPQEEQVAEKVQWLEQENQGLLDQMKRLENQIPSRFHMAQWVGEFTRLAKEIKLDSFKQWITREEGYSKIFLEAKFFATYLNTIKYMAAIESISPFLQVEEMEIFEPKGKTVELGVSSVKLVVVCLLSDNPEQGILAAAKAEGEWLLKRDILTSIAKPKEALLEAQFSLEGITFDPKNSTAIINGDVFQANAEVGGYKIKQISSSSVILSDGVVDHVLNLKGA